MRTAIYIRVSTDKQETENQLNQLRAESTKLGWDVVSEFADISTGGNSDREQFQAMFEAAERREFDVLLFWSLDRLSREGTRVTLNHLDRLEKAGVGFRSLTEGYLDSTGIMKNVVLALLSTMAEQEKKRISERTKAGLAIARQRGRRLGRQVVTVDINRANELRSSGLSTRAIGKLLGVSHATIATRLQAVAA